MAMAAVPASLSIFICALLLSFTASSARSPLNVDTGYFLYPESDGNNPVGPHTILLPTDKASDSDPLPFTLVTIRPLNLPFPISSRLRLRHRCRHNHHFKPFNPLRDIPHADYHTHYDVKGTDVDPVPHGGARHISARWTRFRQVEPSFSREPGTDRSEEMTKPQDQPEPEHQEKGFVQKIRKFLDSC